MLIVDASCLFEVLTGGPFADAVAERFRADDDQGAPHVVDVEVVSMIRREHGLGRLDRTAASQAVADLSTWPGERFGHQPFLGRIWQLRGAVRAWDAAYVALAEAMNAPLLTLDARLSRAPGPRCKIDVLR
jgi:predicted nucleic acid-binding protein